MYTKDVFYVVSPGQENSVSRVVNISTDRIVKYNGILFSSSAAIKAFISLIRNNEEQEIATLFAPARGQCQYLFPISVLPGDALVFKVQNQDRVAADIYLHYGSDND